MIKISNAILGKGQYVTYFYGDYFDCDENLDYWIKQGYTTVPVFIEEYDPKFDFNTYLREKNNV